MQDPLVYLNGTLTPLSEARVPVLDRGFIFGDGVYEVVPMYARRPFCASLHLARLRRSLKAVGIDNPHHEQEWMELLGQVSAAQPADDQLIYIQVTRGVAKRAHAFPQQSTPTVFIMSNPFSPPGPDAVENGVACVSMEDKRWLRCDIKSTSMLGNVLAAQHAAENAVTETIQFRDGFLSEGSSSNIWVVKNGRMMAPPRDALILEGIRYSLIERMCQANSIEFEARRITHDEVLAADEVLMSSASKEILAVVTIDGRQIGDGRPGPVFRTLYAAYQEAKTA